MKTCTRCGDTKPYADFYRQKKAKDGYGYYCKPCSKDYARANDTAGSERSMKWQQENRERYRATRREYAKNNRDKRNAEQALRRGAKLSATPSWLTDDHRFIMREIYSLSALRSEMTGVPHHVDHIVPLRGINVCGLHVPWNLQVITAADNLTKSNL